MITSETQIGRWVSIDLDLKSRKITFEADTGGAASVGAGNIYLAISSTLGFNLGYYNTTAMYKDLQ